jgi:hypothetical protein
MHDDDDASDEPELTPCERYIERQRNAWRPR